MTIIIYRIVACINLLNSLTKEEREGNSSNKQQNPKTALTFFYWTTSRSPAYEKYLEP